MAFQGLKNPASWQKALELARLNREVDESQMPTYRAGSPSRQAGAKISKAGGRKGDFAVDTNDENNSQYFTGFVDRLRGFGATFENPEGMV